MNKREKAIKCQQRIVQQERDEVVSILFAVSEGTINAKQLERRLMDVQERLGSCSDSLAEMLRHPKKEGGGA